MYTGPERKLPRAKGFDYRNPGPYFVTVCTQDRAMRFGEVVEQDVRLYPPGVMVRNVWLEIEARFSGVQLDAFVMMPNHVHGVVTLPASEDEIGMESVSLSDVIAWFKTVTTKRYINGVRRDDWPPFDGRLWQSSFYDHIVRDDQDLDRIREYIVANPSRWVEDDLYEKTIG